MPSSQESKTVTVENGIVKCTDGREKPYLVRYRDANRNQYQKTLSDSATPPLARKRRRHSCAATTQQRTREPFHDFAIEWAPAQDWKPTTREAFPRILTRIERVLPKGARLGDVDQLVIKRARTELQKTYEPRTVDQTIKYLGRSCARRVPQGRVPRDSTIGTNSRRRRHR